jgi:hypothetical protein
MSREKIIDVMAKGLAEARNVTKIVVAGDFRNAIHALTALEAAGFVVVPIEPTDEMLDAALEGDWDPQTVYRAMIQSAKGE